MNTRIRRRLLDGVGLAVVGVPALVVGTLAALVVRVSDGAPVLFAHERVGLSGRRFEVLKFRTMRGDAGPSVTRAGDPRVTPVGRVLRKSKLDELPQLLNVLRGEMSLIGPRPEAPVFVDPTHPAWIELLQARPGITDWTSLLLSDEESLLANFSDSERAYADVLLPIKLRISLEYLRESTFLSDLKLLILTPLVLSGLVDRPTDPRLCTLASVETPTDVR